MQLRVQIPGNRFTVVNCFSVLSMFIYIYIYILTHRKHIFASAQRMWETFDPTVKTDGKNIDSHPARRTITEASDWFLSLFCKMIPTPNIQPDE